MERIIYRHCSPPYHTLHLRHLHDLVPLTVRMIRAPKVAIAPSRRRRNRIGCRLTSRLRYRGRPRGSRFVLRTNLCVPMTRHIEDMKSSATGGLQPGQHPRVENVFQTVPHPSKNGSGVPAQSQRQRLECEGRQLQSGHRIPPNASSSSGVAALTVIRADARSSFRNSCGGTNGSSMMSILSG